MSVPSAFDTGLSRRLARSERAAQIWMHGDRNAAIQLVQADCRLVATVALEIKSQGGDNTPFLEYVALLQEAPKKDVDVVK